MRTANLRNATVAVAALSAGWLSLSALAGEPQGNIPFPADFRGWTHTKSFVQPDKENPFHGFRNVYVNDTGIAAMKAGTTYPEGSLIVMSFHEPVPADGGYAQGKPIKYVLMLKDASATASDGWTYEAYAAGAMKPLVGDQVVQKCHDCHTARRENDFVFSPYTE